MREKFKLITLVLSFDGGPFAQIQNNGQDATFLNKAIDNALVVRYIGLDARPRFILRAALAVTRMQHAMINYSKHWPMRQVLRLLAKSRFLDKVIRDFGVLDTKNAVSQVIDERQSGKSWQKIVVNSIEHKQLIGLKTILAFKHILENYDFDYLFRTNTSSYLDVAKILSFLDTQPKTNVYGGVVSSAFGDLRFASGAGVLLSRDVIERVCRSEHLWKHGLIDDLALGELVSTFTDPKVPILPLERLDLYSLASAKATNNETINANYHFRCKSKNAEETIAVMDHIHKIKRENSL